MTTEHQREQAERRRVLENERKLREQGSTYHARAQADADTPRGRFSAISAQTVTGTSEAAKYPPASAAHQIQLPNEAPTGYPIDQVERD